MCSQVSYCLPDWGLGIAGQFCQLIRNDTVFKLRDENSVERFSVDARENEKDGTCF